MIELRKNIQGENVLADFDEQRVIIIFSFLFTEQDQSLTDPQGIWLLTSFHTVNWLFILSLNFLSLKQILIHNRILLLTLCLLPSFPNDLFWETLSGIL